MLLIFDWDGTISDSTGKIVRCMKMAAHDMGLAELDDEEVRNIIGLGLPEAIRTLYPSISPLDSEALKSKYAAHFIREDQVPSSFYPGVMETLEQLRSTGHRLAVATGKSRRGLDRVLQRLDLGKYFHLSRCADETQSKPHPQMLTELLDESALTVKDAVMVGDTEYDMEMAQRINMPRIAVSYGAHHIDRLKKFSPNLCVDHFSDILEWKPLLDKEG